jgi:hypothetical protein
MTREQQESLPVIYKATYKTLLLELGVIEFSSPNGLSHQALELAKQLAPIHSAHSTDGVRVSPNGPEGKKVTKQR